MDCKALKNNKICIPLFQTKSKILLTTPVNILIIEDDTFMLLKMVFNPLALNNTEFVLPLITVDANTSFLSNVITIPGAIITGTKNTERAMALP